MDHILINPIWCRIESGLQTAAGVAKSRNGEREKQIEQL